jgi:transposase
VSARADTVLIAQLTRDNQRLQVSLDKANLVIEVQKKLAVLLGLATTDDKHGNT